MKNLNLFTWLLECSGNAAKIGLIPCQLRQQDGKNTAKTRQKDGKSSIYRRIITLLTLLLTLNVGQMWGGTGHSLNYPYFYFYNDASWSDVQVIVGRDWTNWNYSDIYTMGKSDNVEKLYFTEIGAYWNDDYNDIAILTGASSWGAEGNNISSRWGYATAHSDNHIMNYDMNLHNTYYWGGKGASSIATSVPTYSTTLNIKVKINGSASYSDATTSNSPATELKITGTYADASGNWGTKRSDAEWSSGSSCTYNTVISGKVTISYNSLNSGWQFDGWYVNGTRKSTNTSYDYYQYANTTVEARFSKIYTVTYYGNGNTTGAVPSASNHASSTTVTVAAKGELAKSNYTFDGWNKANDGSGTNYTAGSGTFTISSNTSLYAKWTQSVTLNANTSHGGSGSNGSATATWNGTALSSISHPSGQTGYTRTGYFTDPTGGTKVLNEDGTYADNNITGYITGGKWSRTEATTLYAQWDNHYTVTFEQGSPTFQGTGDVTATYGAELPAISVPSKTGYIFGGYYTGENGTGTPYYNENGVGLINWAEAANTTLHAQWTGISYQVAFDANEGSGTIANQDFTYGAAATALTSNTTQITRTGYYFLGWNTNADGSGTKYYNGKSVQNLTTTDGGIVTLYAQWAKTYTLYFIQAKCSWGSFYAKAEISYDGQTYYPKGTGNGTAMTNDARGVYMTNFTYNSSHNFALYKIDGVPEGSQIKFSNNGSDPKGNMSWSAEKPYYLYGNSTWYALTQYANPADIDTISTATNMSAHVGATDYGIDQHADGQYAIAELPANTWYTLKYHNWLADGWSGCTATGDASNMITSGTTTGHSGEWTLNGDKDVHIQTTVAGEYKFMLNGWTAGDPASPKADIYYPVGVSLTSVSPNEAIAGVTTTVRLTANPAATYLITSPTYYYQISTDNGSTWTTIAETSSKTYDYTFAAQKCKFRVILKNDAGLRSKSSEQSFTTYSTKSFYVYNPYNTANQWSYLHLYTWDSNDGNRTYNGSFPTGSTVNDCGYIHGVDNATPSNCRNGNNLRYVGNNWFYITIDERANCFMLVGEATYKDHQTVTCYTNGYIEGGKYMIYTRSNANYVEAYQAKGASDYRLKYTYVVNATTKYRYSPIYNTTLDGTTVTTSMWMDASSGTSLTIQQGTGNNTWADRKTYTNSSDGFGGRVPAGYRDHGYVFQMQINFNTGTPTNSTISNVTVSNGPFYVRTDGLTGGWNVYEKADHTMHRSAASLTSGSPAYDYYLCKWVGTAGTNVKFTVADDYNPELVESLAKDPNSGDPLYTRETLPTPTNVRFSWNSQTNTLTRAYLSGATDASSRFLVMVEQGTVGKIYNESGTALTSAAGGQVSGLNEHELLFADNGNWVYQLDMKANPGAQAKVTAKYNGEEPEFIPTTTLIDGSGESMYKYRITYDFKTNIMTNAWVADGSEINTTIDLNTNVMIIRNGQAAEGVTQIRFGSGDDKKIINAKKLISVMEFKYNDMVGTMNTWNTAAYQFCMYYISFPFDVNVSDIFGIGTYGTDWKLQYYDGAERASKGFFRGDGTTTFWKDVPANGKLDKHVGYSLLLNRVKFNDKTSDIWENKGAGSSVYLYFPSTADAETIKDDDNVTIHVPEHPCGINRTFTVDDGNGGTKTLNHMNTDSHWNMMGTPLFEHKTASTIAAPAAINNETLQYFYAWNYTDNTLSPKATLKTSGEGVQTFNAMHAYMVQYAGDVTFSGAAIHPASIAARRTAETRNLNIELQVLNANEEEINRTYVQLKDGADADFRLNEDMYMVTNSRVVNIYTYAGDYDVAANVLPLETTTVPVGVMVKTAGSYTFSMPSDFSGTVTLVDSFTQTRTNLAVEDYTVDLEKGTFNDRFLLEININKVPTAIDGVPGGSLKDGKAHKFIENGAMYILQDGKIYDARGNRLQ